MRFERELVLVAALLLGACGRDRLRVPRMASDAPSGPAERVTHPPPAALPEIVSEAPNGRVRWLDGYWIFQADNWVWVRGGWVDVPPGTFLVPSRFWIEEEGVLRFSDRRFIDEDGRSVEAPQIVEPAATPPVPTLPEGSTLP